jgi:hypothetical protein
MNEAVPPYRSEPLPDLELEFPDWSGQRRGMPSATMENIHRKSLSLLSQNSLPTDFDERRLKNKVSVEFKL